MKKSVVLALIAVYVLSICIVGYFGLKVRIYRPTVYPTEIKIISVRDASTGEKLEIFADPEAEVKQYVMLKWHDDMRLRIQVEIKPDDTTKRELSYEFGHEGVCEVVSDGGGGITQEVEISFAKRQSMTITIKAKDTPTCSDSIEINFLR